MRPIKTQKYICPTFKGCFLLTFPLNFLTILEFVSLSCGGHGTGTAGAPDPWILLPNHVHGNAPELLPCSRPGAAP